MKLQTKKIIAREFLILLVTALIGLTGFRRITNAITLRNVKLTASIKASNIPVQDKTNTIRHKTNNDAYPKI